MSFLEDGTKALEWAAGYRERVGDLPVLADVEPGDVRALLPRTAPEQGQSFASLLEDIDRVILPGVTHWQSPRFFAYFSTTGSAPGVLAELITAALNNVGVLWRASPALQELEETVMAWLAELLGLPAGWHGHLEEGASLSTLAALAAAREAKRVRASWSSPSTRTRPSTRPAACSSWTCARCRPTRSSASGPSCST